MTFGLHRYQDGVAYQMQGLPVLVMFSLFLKISRLFISQIYKYYLQFYGLVLEITSILFVLVSSDPFVMLCIKMPYSRVCFMLL